MRDFDRHIKENWNEFHNKEISVACSGGLDSTVLLDLLSRKGFNVSAIHVNYHLRGEDSNLDEAFIREFCAIRNIPFDCRSVELSKQLENGGNLQQLAREVRYNWFEEITLKNSQAFIFLAHHLDDQVETFFINLARKSGMMGLACMPFERDQIVRPLLDFTKEELKDYADSKQLTWREDVSNTSNKYRRNFVRNEILPFLSSQLPELNESVITLVKTIQANQALLETEIEPLVNAILTTQTINFSTIEKLNEFQLIELFRQLGQPIQVVNEFKALFTSQKGKRIELMPNPTFSQIVKDNDTYSFLTNTVEQLGCKLVIEQVRSLPSEFDKDEIYLDQENISGELKLRFWKIGDRIEPIGMKGSQLISDVISDAKLTSLDKNRVKVVHDDVTIHWCVGMKVGRKSIASKSSERIIKVTVSNAKFN